MPANFTRRRLAALAATPLLAAAGPSAAAAQAPAPADDDLTIQRANLQRWREQMAQVKLARDTEPIVTFKA